MDKSYYDELKRFSFALSEKKEEREDEGLSFESKPLRIRIIATIDQFGRGKDYRILEEELIALGHEVQFLSPKSNIPDEVVDVNLFLNEYRTGFIPFAHGNYFIPNPEWCYFDESYLKECNYILCRTKEVDRICKDIGLETYELGFTSCDYYQEDVKKAYHKPFHTIGMGIQKGTQELLNVWEKNPDFPKLTFLESRELYTTNAPNVDQQVRFVAQTDYIRLMNEHGLHIYPCHTEGYGHLILEAMSTGAVVITTDAPPMNEHIRDSRFLVRWETKEQVQMATKYYADEKHLEEVIRSVLQMSEEELKEVGEQNREYYLKGREKFRENLKNLFGEAD